MARQIEDTVTIRLYTGDGQPLPLWNEAHTNDYTETGIDYSLLRYVDYMIENGSETMKALAQAAKDYCYAAKNHFTGSADPLSDAVSAVTADMLSDYVSKRSGSLPQGVSIDSATAMFKSDNSFRMYLKFADGTDADSITYQLDGVDTELMTTPDGARYLTFDKVSSSALGKEHVFTICDGTATYSVTASVLTYARGAHQQQFGQHEDAGKGAVSVQSCFRSPFRRMKGGLPMKKYEDLEIDVIVFNANDVITTSGEDEGEPVPGDQF